LATVDLASIENGIRALVTADPRPIEADVLRVELNRKLGLTCTKYFYRSICERMADTEDWEIARSIIGQRPLPFRSVRDAISLVQQGGFDVGRLVEDTQTRLRVTDEIATPIAAA
jgi:hypothetical protein